MKLDWPNVIVVSVVILGLITLTAMGKIGAIDVVPMLASVLTYTMSVHVVNATSSDKKDDESRKP